MTTPDRPPKTVYLASPYGFSEQQKALLLPELVGALEGLGLEVWEPFARNNQVDGRSGTGPGASGRRISGTCGSRTRSSRS